MAQVKHQTGNWNQIKGKLKERFSGLSEKDLKMESGRVGQTFGRLRQILGKPEDTAHLIDRL